MNEHRTFHLPMIALVALRFRGCNCEPVGCEVDHDDVPGGVYRFVMHADSCRFLFIRAAQWN